MHICVHTENKVLFHKPTDAPLSHSNEFSARHVSQIKASNSHKHSSLSRYTVCDPATDDRLQRRKEEYEADIAVKDYRELLNDPNVDAAIVAAPDQYHAEITCAFLRAGVRMSCWRSPWLPHQLHGRCFHSSCRPRNRRICQHRKDRDDPVSQDVRT